MSRLERSLLNLAPTGIFENRVEVTQTAPNASVMAVGELRSERTRLGPPNGRPSDTNWGVSNLPEIQNQGFLENPWYLTIPLI